VEEFNLENSDAIASDEIEALKPSSSEFIEKASGIKSRYVMYKGGALDTKTMMPLVPERSNEELSIQAEMAVAAVKQCMLQIKSLKVLI